VIDAPKTLNQVTMNAFDVSDRIYLLTTADLQSLRNVTRSLPLLNGLAGSRPDDWIRLVVNRYNPALAITVGEVERTLGMKVHWTLRNDYRAVIDSINAGRPAVLDGDSVYARNVRELAGEVTGVRGTPKAKAGILGGLLAGLSGKKGGGA
jgi:Flp pilus assembly CpaE family ATPase